MEEHRHPIHRRATVGCDVEVGRGVERRKMEHAPATAHEEAEIVGEAGRGIGVSGDDDHRSEPGFAADRLGEQVRSGSGR